MSDEAGEVLVECAFCNVVPLHGMKPEEVAMLRREGARILVELEDRGWQLVRRLET